MSSFSGNSSSAVGEKCVKTDFCSRFQTEFCIYNLLGKGGYGVVFEVGDKKDGQKYAIKRINLANKPRNLMEREIKIRDCQHPNIVKYFNSWIERPPPKWQENQDQIWMERFNLLPIALPYYDIEICEDFDPTDKTDTSVTPSEYFYIQMELCQKYDLADWLLENDAIVRKTQYLSIFKQICAALKYLRSKRLIYRDLKPENILFGLDGRIKIADFGTVIDHDLVTSADKICWKSRKCHVMHTAGIGTDSYKAPELDGTNYDYEVDIFSLGVILFELISPFRTPSERHDAIDRLRNSSFSKDIDAEFEKEFDLVKWMLSTNPKERPTIELIEKHMTRWETNSSKIANLSACLGYRRSILPTRLKQSWFVQTKKKKPYREIGHKK